MVSAVSIRRAEKADIPAIGRLISAIQREEFGIPITLEDQPDLADIDKFYRSGAGDFWVAEASGQIVGTIALIDIGRGQGALRKMFVHEDFRGAGTGVARQLLDVLLAHSRNNGLTKIILGTTAKFLAAHRFYEKNGFRLIDARELPKSFPRMAVDTRFYRIDL
jgi:N-acetylglutamate synthase-like GNAT family acetyltransferase